MEILSGLESLPAPNVRTSIVTWGVFDGVHRGHRKVLEMALSWARGAGVSSVVVTFDRHPAEVLGRRPVPLVTPLGERLRLIGQLGVDFCVMINFTADFSRTPAERFLRGVVVEGLRARGVVLGHDSRFGRDREGDLELLACLGRRMGLEVRRCEPEQYRGRPVSSSLIREAMASGRLDEAAFLLGRPPAVVGTVVHGQRRGAKAGFPTANLDLGNTVCPPRGVYAVDVPLDGRSYRGVVNIGVRPTFGEGGAEVFEVHLLDYSGHALYGRTLEIRFLARLRDERKFEGPEALRRQIEQDVASARVLQRGPQV